MGWLGFVCWRPTRFSRNIVKLFIYLISSLVGWLVSFMFVCYLKVQICVVVNLMFYSVVFQPAIVCPETITVGTTIMILYIVTQYKSIRGHQIWGATWHFHLHEGDSQLSHYSERADSRLHQDILNHLPRHKASHRRNLKLVLYYVT